MALATPNDFEFWEYQGINLAALGKYQEAITSFNQALNLNPNYSEAFYHKARCYSLLGNIDQAINNLQYAIGLDFGKLRKRAENDLDFDLIRDHWRFEAILDGELRFICHNVTWAEFANFVTETGDDRSSRIAYDRGVLEIIIKSNKHEYYNRQISSLIMDLVEQLGFDYCIPLGSTTWKRKDLLKSAEPDSCFYIQSALKILDKILNDEIDLVKDPPPDLILEVDYNIETNRKLSVYAGFGVPEVWLYDFQDLHIYQLQNGEYQETKNSLIFSGFPVIEIPEFLRKNKNATRPEFRKALREWVDKVSRRS